MKRKTRLSTSRMEKNQMSLKMKPNSRTYKLNFSSDISHSLAANHIAHVSLVNGRLVFTATPMRSRYESAISYNRHSKSHTASVSSRAIVTTIAEFEELGEGLHYINLKSPIFESGSIIFPILNVDRSFRYDKEPEPEPQHPTVQQPTLPFSIATFSDKDLFDELKRRGYEGKLTKTTKIELQ